MTFIKASQPIVRDKVIPRGLFMGKPSIETTFIRHTFNVDGTVEVCNENGDSMTINPLSFGFQGTVDLLEDSEAKIVLIEYKFKHKNKDYAVQVYFYFGVDQGSGVKVKIKGTLPSQSKIVCGFKLQTCKFDVAAKRLWSGKIENGEVASGVGFDWSDVKTAYSVDASEQKVSFTVGTVFEIDPSTIATVSYIYAVRYQFARKTFYAAGRHWAFYSDSSYVAFRSSVDGITWTDADDKTFDTGVSRGEYFSVWFDGTYVHVVAFIAAVSSLDTLYYRRGTPNSDGTITWSDRQVAIPLYQDETGVRLYDFSFYLRDLYTGVTDIRTMIPTSPGTTEDYTTEVNIGTNPAGSKFVFTPYTTVTTPVGTSLPTAIQNKGWMYAIGSMSQKKIWVLDGRFPVMVTVKNPDAIVHAGNLYARLWVSPNSDMSGATALTGWQYAAVSFSGTAGQTVAVTINFDISASAGASAFAIAGQYFYVEFLWDVTTAASNARVQLEAAKLSTVRVPVPSNNVPTITVDSNGYPWVGFQRSNGINYYPYLIKGDAHDGTFTFKSSTVWKLNATGSLSWYGITPVALTAGKMLILYDRSSSYSYSRYYDGSSLGSEVTTFAILDGVSKSPSAVANGDTVEMVYLSSGYNILHRRWSAGSWLDMGTVQSGVTTSSAPVLSINPNTGDLYCFWAGSPTANHIYYKKFTYSTSTWDANPTDWIDESTDGLTSNQYLTCFYQAYGTYLDIGLIYMTKAGPYDIRYAFLSLVIPVVPKVVGDGLTFVVA